MLFFFQMSLRGPPGPLGLTGRPGPLVWISLSDLYQICIISQGLLRPLPPALNSIWPSSISCHSLPPQPHHYACSVYLNWEICLYFQKKPPKNNQKTPKRWKNETIFRWFIFSSFLNFWFGSIFEEYVCIHVYTFEKVEFPLFVMSCMTFYFPGWSRFLWAQRRTWRKWLCCKTRYNFYLAYLGL